MAGRIGGFFHPDRLRNVGAEGKESRIIDGKPYCWSSRLRGGATSSRCQSWRAIHAGNLFSCTARRAETLNPVMARPPPSVAEVEHLVHRQSEWISRREARGFTFRGSTSCRAVRTRRDSKGYEASA